MAKVLSSWCTGTEMVKLPSLPTLWNVREVDGLMAQLA